MGPDGHDPRSFHGCRAHHGPENTMPTAAGRIEAGSQVGPREAASPEPAEAHQAEVQPMTDVNMAHIRIQGISVAVFDARPTSGSDRDRQSVLDRLVMAARRTGMLVQKAALAYRDGRSVRFFGTPDLVRYLTRAGVPRWTHRLTVDS